MKLEIYNEAGLTTDDVTKMPDYLTGEIDFYGTSAYDKLYEYFAFETGEMPYGVAKARTGDPDLWILERLDADGVFCGS